MSGYVGLRFRPTEEEIISYYIDRKMAGLDFPVHAIKEVDVLKYEPWDLPELSACPDNKVWYFFNAPSYKYANSKRTNRTTRAGYWKVTGRDRVIWDDRGTRVIGIKKNLVFYEGRMPNGVKTNWVIHEYHSNNASLNQKEIVLWRLKRKSDNGSNSSYTRNEPSCGSTFPSENHVAENTTPQANFGLPVEPASLNSSGLDHNTLPAADLMTNQEQGPFFSNWPSDELGIILQDTYFYNSLLPDKDGFWEKTTFTHDSVNETIYAQSGQVLESPSLFNTSASSKEGWKTKMVRPPNETPSSSNQNLCKFVNSAADIPEINCIELIRDEVSTGTRTCKVQHLPKSHNFAEKECAPKRLQLQGKISRKAVSKDEARKVAEHAFDLPREENSIVNFVKDQKKAQTTNPKASAKFISDWSDRSDSKGSFIFLETPPLSHKTKTLSVYIGNVLLAVFLLIFFIGEIGSLHN